MSPATLTHLIEFTATVRAKLADEDEAQRQPECRPIERTIAVPFLPTRPGRPFGAWLKLQALDDDPDEDAVEYGPDIADPATPRGVRCQLSFQQALEGLGGIAREL
jgi:hypothetical protein